MHCSKNNIDFFPQEKTSFSDTNLPSQQFTGFDEIWNPTDIDQSDSAQSRVNMKKKV